MYTEGFINLHRKILDWEWYDDINVFRVFTHLLLTVNWTPAKWHGIEILPGQRITSREILATETGLSVRQIRTALEKLKKTRRNNHQNDQQIYSCKYCKLWVLSI